MTTCAGAPTRTARDPFRRNRRARRRRCKLPRRFGVASQIGAFTDEREHAVIDRVIRWCATNRGLVAAVSVDDAKRVASSPSEKYRSAIRESRFCRDVFRDGKRKNIGSSLSPETAAKSLSLRDFPLRWGGVLFLESCMCAPDHTVRAFSEAPRPHFFRMLTVEGAGGMPSSGLRCTRQFDPPRAIWVN